MKVVIALFINRFMDFYFDSKYENISWDKKFLFFKQRMFSHKRCFLKKSSKFKLISLFNK